MASLPQAVGPFPGLPAGPGAQDWQCPHHVLVPRGHLHRPVDSDCSLNAHAVVPGERRADYHRELREFISRPIVLLYTLTDTDTSQGAAAVLEYCAIESPLAQPRNALLGHLFAAIIGRSVTELFLLSPHHDELWWIAGPLGCAIATLVMILTKTVHPPAGATALLAVVDPNTRHLGWFLLPVVLLSSVLILASALLFNNINRRFPLHWWTPDTLSRRQTKEFDSSSSETESGGETYRMSRDLERGGIGGPPAPEPAPRELDHIAVKHGQVLIPDGIVLAPDEVEFLERLSRRI